MNDLHKIAFDYRNAALPDDAAELDRLHELNAELVEALKDLLGEVTDGYEPHEVFITQAKAALAKAQGDNNANG